MENNNELKYEDRKELPALYNIDARGKERIWRNWVVNDKVCTIYGLIDGKKIEKERVFKGKSIGRKNEVSPFDQAWLEATKTWIKKTEKGYLPRDEEGKEMLKSLTSAKQLSGGHNVNAVASVAGNSARATKTIKRDIGTTNIITDYSGAVPIPMKAQVWSLKNDKDPTSVEAKVEKYFTGPDGSDLPFYGQPKLDGWRVAVKCYKDDNGEWKVIMTSNGGKQYPWFAEMRKAVVSLAQSFGDRWKGLILDGFDGEFYVLALFSEDGIPIPEPARFRTLSSICGLSKSKPSPIEDQLQLNVFDLVDAAGVLTQAERFLKLDTIFENLTEEQGKFICRVPTEILANVREVPDYLNRMVDLGYEGIVVRTMLMKYDTGHKSKEMRKFKYFIDAEYKVVGAQLDPGVGKEYFVWLCEVDLTVKEWVEKGVSLPASTERKTFKATPNGKTAEKHKMYDNRASYYGRRLTVKFQEFSQDGIPRFPIGKAFRESGDV